MMNRDSQSLRPAVRGSPPSRASKTPTDGSRWAFTPRNRADRSPESPRTAVRGSLRTFVFILAAAALCSAADGLDEFRIKREGPFEFERTPVVTRAGDRVTITFEAKAFCDVTVAIEEVPAEKGTGTSASLRSRSPFPRIVRHLASGVLGPKAPAPFERNSKAQTLVWDGKDDFGNYIDDKSALSVRVSLGLAPRFERTLFWSPHKRISASPPQMAAAPEGVYVFEGMGVDHLRLFDHDGNYMRTIYPFPAEKVAGIKGLKWHTFPQDMANGIERPLPLKVGHYQSTLFSSGDNALGRVTRPSHPPAHGLSGRAGAAFAVRNRRAALAAYHVSRFSTDGTTGPVALTGPKTSLPQLYGGGSNWRRETHDVFPTSAALSPDGKTLYLAGYKWDKWPQDGWYDWWHCLNGVLSVPTDGSDTPAVFVGTMTEEGHGTDNRSFRCAMSVACDLKGRVHVCDYMNDRIQVYAPDGAFLKTIPAEKPVYADFNHRTGEIYVFSWALGNQFTGRGSPTVTATLTRLKSFDDPRPVARYPLPLVGYRPDRGRMGHMLRVAVDSWTDPATIWMVVAVPSAPQMGGGFAKEHKGWASAGIRLLVEHEGRLREKRDFAKDAKRAVVRIKPATFSRQRLYVNPATGDLFLAEDLGFSKSFKDVVRIDPRTGRAREVELPFDAEDMAFDLKGRAYLRTRTIVARYDPSDWREVPFDYGVSRPSVGTSWSGVGKRSPVTSGIPLHSATLWHHGGMSVSAGGHIIVACTAAGKLPEQRLSRRGFAYRGGEDALKETKQYTPVLYPGRVVPKKGAVVHIWDEHGRMVHEDAVPGLDNCDGTYIDRDDNVYVLSARRRMLGGAPYFNSKTGTLMKFRPRAGRILSASNRAEIPLPENEHPKQPTDFADSAWARNAEWLYGGVDFAPSKDNICACSNARFWLDYFGRSFAPEVRHYSVAVLDTNGNLILRVGRYGNIDDRLPGDGVGLIYAPYVAGHTDHRLFIADPGNARIVSVRLDYHATERVALKDVADEGD